MSGQLSCRRQRFLVRQNVYFRRSHAPPAAGAARPRRRDNRIEILFAAVHKSAFGTKRTHHAMRAECPILGVKRICENQYQQVVNVSAQWQRKRVYWWLASGSTDFDLNSISLGKHILNRQDPESEDVVLDRHTACQLHQMWRTAIRAGGVRILRCAQFAPPLDMRALRLFF